MANKIIFDSYIMYGLNHNRKFMEPPTCEDCGGNAGLVLETKEELMSFCCEMLMEHDCDCCAIFIVRQNGKFEAVFKTLVDGEYRLAKIDSKDRKMFAELDGEFRFCCYSLLLETAKGVFEIQE